MGLCLDNAVGLLGEFLSANCVGNSKQYGEYPSSQTGSSLIVS